MNFQDHDPVHPRSTLIILSIIGFQPLNPFPSVPSVVILEQNHLYSPT